jgi:hypothetical protein
MMGPRFVLPLLVAVSAGLAAAAVFALRSDREASAFGAVAARQASSALLGVVLQPPEAELTRVDPRTLRPLPGRRIAVGSGGCAPRAGGEACFGVPPWSHSPDGSRLALGRNGDRGVRSLRVVDVERRRVTADLPLEGGPLGLLAWLAPRRVLAVQEVCCAERQRLLAVDVRSGRVAARRALRGSVVAVARTSRRLVLLIAPAEAIGPARLAVADRHGAVRVRRLGPVRAGTKFLGRRPFHRVEQRLPGLTVDAAGRRAFVVEPGLVAEVDLGSLAVSYHEPAQAARLGVPAADAKAGNSRTRFARWLGGGLLAVSGADEEAYTDARDRPQTRIRPAGLQLVDTRSWGVRTIDPGASQVLVAGDLLLATGARFDSGAPRRRAIGLRAYGFDGDRRFGLFPGKEASVHAVHAGRAYVVISRPDGRQEPARVVDLAGGRVTGTRPGPLPWLVTDAASSWWEGP